MILAAAEKSFLANERKDDNSGAWFQKHSHVLTSLNESCADFELAAFAEDVGEARFVVLCAQSHGEGNVFGLQGRLVQYLHQHCGFEVLAMGSGMYDLLQVWEDIKLGQHAATAVLNNLFYMYSRCPQLRFLFEYITQCRYSDYPLILAGCDGPQGGRKSTDDLLAHLSHFLEQYGFIELKEKVCWSGFVRAAERIISRSKPLIDSISDVHDFQKMLKLLFPVLGNNELHQLSNDESRLLYLSLEGLQAQLVELQVGEKRDWHMFSNIKWLAESVYSGKKFIIWVHSMRGLPSGGNSLGDLLRDNYGMNGVYIAHFTALGGCITDYEASQNTIALPHLSEGSWESEWEKAKNENGYITFRSLIKDAVLQHDLYNNLTFRRFRYCDEPLSVHNVILSEGTNSQPIVDSLFFIQKVEPVKLSSVEGI